jgi:hypothetical protein
MSETHLMAPSANWLTDTVATGGYTGGSVPLNTSITIQDAYWYQPAWYPYYAPVYLSSPARPIKLGLSEVEHLRKGAAADAKLKAILQKFTSLIEITVDFD